MRRWIFLVAQHWNPFPSVSSKNIRVIRVKKTCRIFPAVPKVRTPPPSVQSASSLPIRGYSHKQQRLAWISVAVLARDLQNFCLRSKYVDITCLFQTCYILTSVATPSSSVKQRRTKAAKVAKETRLEGDLLQSRAHRTKSLFKATVPSL